MRNLGTYMLFLFIWGATLHCTEAANENLRGNKRPTDEKKQIVGDDYSSKRFLNMMNEAAQADEDDIRYVVKFKEDVNIQTARMRGRQYDEVITVMPKDNLEVINLNSLEAVQEMEERDEVISVEKDHKVYLQQFPNEDVPYGINLVNALDVPDDNISNRKVCIIDTGYDLSHPDLPKASTGASITGTGASNLEWSKDGDGHGTHVAGTIAAVGNNNQGIVGVNRNGQLNLHIVRIFDNNGKYVWASTLVSAVEDCAANGANVVNMSLGGGGFSKFEDDAYKRIFEEENVLIIAAAGNGGNTRLSYPASFDAVMSVAAVDSNEILASFSQRNSKVEIAAPGVGVLSTVPGGQYRRFDGTSMACPHVAGVAALVWSNFPEKSAAEIRNTLRSTAKDLGTPGRDDSYGYGLIQADKAYSLLSGALTSSPTITPTPELTCNDSPPGWYDEDGEVYSCQWYSRFGRCEAYGNSFPNPENGKTANEACCACGGGRRASILNTNQPSSIASSSPSATPIDYASERPSMEASLDPSATPTATQSEFPSKKPSTSPSVTPTMSPINPGSSLTPTSTESLPPTGSVCVDTGGWYDSGGPFYDCDWYNKSNNCVMYGNFFENYGETAKEACCTCGGGSNSGDCVDIKDWFDSGGRQFTCAWYGSRNRCSIYGSSFENGGHTANSACCVCKNA